MKATTLVISFASAAMLHTGMIHAGIDFTNTGSVRSAKLECEQQRRSTVQICEREFDQNVARLLAKQPGKKSLDIGIYRTEYQLCVLEAERDNDYCQVAASFLNTNIVDALLYEGIELQPVFTNSEVSIEDIVPALSGSNYRSMSMLCNQLPGGNISGSSFHAWTGINLSWECSQDVWEACMNDPDMGSNASGSAPHPDHASEREQNCFEAMYMHDIPVL